MCPNNPIGPIDLYLVSHHGTDASGSAVLVHGLQPRVAVMQNGTRKGAGTQAMPTMRSSPGLEDIWQLHWGYGAGMEQNSAGVFIANIDEPAVIAGVLTAPPRGGGPGRGGPGAGGPGGRRSGRGSVQAAAGPGAGGPGARPDPVRPDPARADRVPVRRLRAGRAPQPAGAPGAPPPAGGPAGTGPQPGGPGQGGPGGGRGGGAAAAHTPAYWIKISAEQNGTFTVTNSRNNFSKTYTKR